MRETMRMADDSDRFCIEATGGDQLSRIVAGNCAWTVNTRADFSEIGNYEIRDDLRRRHQARDVRLTHAPDEEKG